VKVETLAVGTYKMLKNAFSEETLYCIKTFN
jgi:hypothetical protein